MSKFVNVAKNYKTKFVFELKDELKLRNVYQVPKLLAIVLSMSTKILVHNKKYINELMQQLSLISCQKPIICVAKQSISNFKLREGNPIGCKVTLRNKRMYSFYEKLLQFCFPAQKDFRGYSVKGFDKYGNYSLGIKEQISFFEIDYEKFPKIIGLNVTFVTSAKNKYEGYHLLKKLNFPFYDEMKRKII